MSPPTPQPAHVPRGHGATWGRVLNSGGTLRRGSGYSCDTWELVSLLSLERTWTFWASWRRPSFLTTVPGKQEQEAVTAEILSRTNTGCRRPELVGVSGHQVGVRGRGGPAHPPASSGHSQPSGLPPLHLSSGEMEVLPSRREIPARTCTFEGRGRRPIRPPHHIPHSYASDLRGLRRHPSSAAPTPS